MSSTSSSFMISFHIQCSYSRIQTGKSIQVRDALYHWSQAVKHARWHYCMKLVITPRLTSCKQTSTTKLIRFNSRIQCPSHTGRLHSRSRFFASYYLRSQNPSFHNRKEDRAPFRLFPRIPCLDPPHQLPLCLPCSFRWSLPSLLPFSTSMPPFVGSNVLWCFFSLSASLSFV